MTDAALDEGAASQRLAGERLVWRFRLAAVGFASLQSLIEPGDDLALTWTIVALFWASVAWSGLALRGAPRTGPYAGSASCPWRRMWPSWAWCCRTT